MDYRLTDEDREICELAKRFFADHSGPVPGESYVPAHFTEMSELGFFDLTAAETSGGMGLGPLAEGLVLEQAGWHLYSGPLLERYAANAMLAAAGLAAKGQVIPTIGWRTPRREATVRLSDGKLNGSAVIGFADDESALAVLCGVGGGTDDVSVALAFAYDSGVAITPEHHEDPSWTAGRVEFGPDCSPTAATQVGPSRASALIAHAAALAAAYELGVAQRLLDDTVDYVTGRRQFGVPIGSFQAIKHGVADMWTEIEHARSLLYGALAWDDDAEAARLRRLAKIAVDRITAFVGDRALQYHGGIGFTWESHPHRFVRCGLRLAAWPTTTASMADEVRADLFESSQEVP